MPHQKPDIPERHGEVVARPAIDTWASLARDNANAAAAWRFEVGGRDVGALRSDARREALALSREYTTSLGLEGGATRDGSELVVMTGHQPEIFHPGVWVKYFMLQRLAAQTGAVAVDFILDSDTFSWLSVPVPCFEPDATRCRLQLTADSGDRPFAGAPVPSSEEIEEFCSAGMHALGTLSAPAIEGNFNRFCDILSHAAGVADDLPGFVTTARRRYEGDSTDYLELPVTGVARTRSYLAFAADILLDAARFARCYNDELAAHRAEFGIRSAAQPFPDLEAGPEGVEVPFWLIGEEMRERVFVREGGAGRELVSATGHLMLPADPGETVDTLLGSGVILAPRAVTLTIFARLLVADLFIHGIGGARYDRVAEGVASRFWEVTLPPFVVGSLTMHLPLETPDVSSADVAELDKRLERLTHNPDEFIGDFEFSDAGQESLAVSLAAEKNDLVSKIGTEGADKKAIGARIRDVNASLAELLEPAVAQMVAEREALEAQREAHDVLTDRTYPFCLWSPADIADTVR